MSRDKQIREMAQKVCEFAGTGNCTLHGHCEEGCPCADVAIQLYNAGYRKSQDVAEEIFAEIEFEIHQLDFDREETRAIAIEGIIAELKKKYTESEKENG